MSDSLPAAADIAPLPGDPAGIRIRASKYTATAEAVRQAAAELRRLASASSVEGSDAVAALVEVSESVAGRLDALDGRYETAGSELTTYAGVLETAQADANSAVSARDDAAGDESTNRYWYDHYSDQLRTATTPEAQQEAQTQVTRYDGLLDQASSALVSARTLYQNAVQARDTAAETAANNIATAIDNDGLNDSLWDDFSGWVAEHAELLKAIKNVLGWITTALSILSLFIPVLAPFALLAAGLTAGLSLLLAATGQISWLEFGLDFLTFATMGVAAIGGAAVKTSMGLLKSTRVSNLVAQQTGKNALRQVTGSFSRTIPNGGYGGSAGAWLLKGLKNPSMQRGKDMIAWGREIWSAKGLQNAKDLRILLNAKAGGGGAVDDALVSLAQGQIRINQVVRDIGQKVNLGNTVLGTAGTIGDRIEEALPDGIDLPQLNIPGDLLEEANRSTTWRVGSGW